MDIVTDDNIPTDKLEELLQHPKKTWSVGKHLPRYPREFMDMIRHMAVGINKLMKCLVSLDYSAFNYDRADLYNLISLFVIETRRFYIQDREAQFIKMGRRRNEPVVLPDDLSYFRNHMVGEADILVHWIENVPRLVNKFFHYKYARRTRIFMAQFLIRVSAIIIKIIIAEKVPLDNNCPVLKII